MNRKHVFLVVPSISGMVTTHIAHFFSVAQKMNATADHPFVYSVGTVEGIRGYALARNNIAQQFLASECDILWMIDDDIAPEANAFDLLKSDADIVAPMMPTLTYDYNMQTKKLNYTEEFAAFRFGDLNDLTTKAHAKDALGSGVVEVDAVGFGCTVIKGHVMRDRRMRESGTYLRQDGKVYELQETDPPPIFHSRMMPNGVCALSEDVDFCLRARKLGYSVKLDTNIEVGHKKSLDILPLLMIKRHLEKCSSSVMPVEA